MPIDPGGCRPLAGVDRPFQLVVRGAGPWRLELNTAATSCDVQGRCSGLSDLGLSLRQAKASGLEVELY
jgi:hypothetical protein